MATVVATVMVKHRNKRTRAGTFVPALFGKTSGLIDKIFVQYYNYKKQSDRREGNKYDYQKGTH